AAALPSDRPCQCKPSVRALPDSRGRSVRRVSGRFREERGQALISGLILLAGVLLPLLFLVPLFARVEQGRLAAEQAARDAVRAAVESPSPTAAEAAARAAGGRGRAPTRGAAQRPPVAQRAPREG